MKTIEEIEIEVIDELGIIDYTNDYVHEVARRYALEAMKSDREKIIDTKVYICEIDDITEPMLDDHQKEIILNLPYDLK